MKKKAAAAKTAPVKAAPVKKYTKTELRTIANTMISMTGGYAETDIGALARDWLRLNPEPKEMPALTERQAAIFYFYKEQMLKTQTTPTVRETARQFGINSPNGVICHLKALAKKGLMFQLAGSTARCWRITEGY